MRVLLFRLSPLIIILFIYYQVGSTAALYTVIGVVLGVIFTVASLPLETLGYSRRVDHQDDSPLQRSTYQMIEAEVWRGRKKFPRPAYLTVALGEEFGELCQAQLQRKSRSDVQNEAVQVAALAVRIIEESDVSLSNIPLTSRIP